MDSKTWFVTADVQPTAEFCFLVPGSLDADLVTPVYLAGQVVSSSRDRQMLREMGYALKSIPCNLRALVLLPTSDTGNLAQFVKPEYR